MEIRPYPEFSWSISRQRRLDQCPRSYYYSYYLSHNGWMDDAPPDASLAYRLKQLCSLDTELGHQIDERARELEACARGGRPLPEPAELEARTRAALNACWKSSRSGCEEFEWAPRRVTMLRCVYFDQDSRAEIERVEQKLRVAHETLLATAHWERLAECGEEGRVEVPEFAHFVLDDDLRVFAAPDLAYVHGGVAHVIDWKTGREEESNDLQVKLQAWWLRETRPELADLDLRGYLEYLTSSGTVTQDVALDGDFRAEAAQAVRDGVAQMRRLLSDPERNIPLGVQGFERREGPLCRGCNFQPLCD